MDPEYFARIGLSNDMCALLVRFSVSKPNILHMHWIPMVRKLPFEIWFLSRVKKLGIKLVYTVQNDFLVHASESWQEPFSCIVRGTTHSSVTPTKRRAGANSW